MDTGTWILVCGFAAGAYMAWNIGANDVANGMAPAVGAKAITLKQAVIIAGILDFLGAAFIGSHVTDTIRNNIVDPVAMTDPHTVSLGLLAALLAAAFWVFFASWRNLPVSTTHSVVGAMLGFGIVTGGWSVIQWAKVSAIVLSWVVSPLFSSLLAYFMFRFIRDRILASENRFERAMAWSPFFGGVTFCIIILSFLLKTPLGNRLNMGWGESLLLAGVCSLALATAGRTVLRRTIRARGEQGVEEIFRRLQLVTACYVALAHGANDVANAMGPLAGIYIIHDTQTVNPEVPVPFMLLALGGAFIALGVITWGYRVIETVGRRITTLTNTRGFSVEFGTATCVLLASKLGMPVSTTHAAVGAVVGVGLAGGWRR